MFIKYNIPQYVSSYSHKIRTALQSVTLGLSALLLPVMAFAQNTPVVTAEPANACTTRITDLTSMLNYFLQCLLSVYISRLIILVAVFLLMVGVVRYIVKGAQGNTDYDQSLRKFLFWGIIAMFVMLSVWGLVFFIGSTLGIGQGGVAPVPQLPE